MKRIFAIFITFLFATVVFAQTRTEIKIDQLPKKVSEYITKNLPGAKTERAMKEVDKGVISYYTLNSLSDQHHILVFDKDGNFLKKGDNIFKESQKSNPPKPGAPPAEDKSKTEQTKPKK
jgi:hypothetical protein